MAWNTARWSCSVSLAHQKVFTTTSFGESGLTSDNQCRWQSLHARQFAWSSVIDGVSCHEKGEQTRVGSFNFWKWSILESGPWAVNHCNSMRLDNVSVLRREAGTGIWRQNYSTKLVTNGELTNKTFSNQFTARTFLWVTVTKILNRLIEEWHYITSCNSICNV